MRLNAGGDFYVRFWGVRGSVACAGPDTLRYGGNTSCLEIRCGDDLLIFDAGTGIRYLGNDLMKQGGVIDTHIFLTHTHFDHICGILFFAPFFIPGNRIEIASGHLGDTMTTKHALSGLMMSPLFPVDMTVFNADLTFTDFTVGSVLRPREGITLKTLRLHHTNGATGYRIEYQDKSICYITDHEHGDEVADQRLVSFIEGADIVIYDATYTDEEYLKNHVGWGHSTWQQGARFCDMANVGTYVVFHHDPDHDDDFMDQVAEDASARRPGTIVAREGMILKP